MNSSGTSTYYRVTRNSKIGVLRKPPSLFIAPPNNSSSLLNEFLDELKRKRNDIIENKSLIDFVHDSLKLNGGGDKDKDKNRKLFKVAITARIVVVQALIVKWQCLGCHGDIINDGACEHGCVDKSRFLIEGR